MTSPQEAAPPAAPRPVVFLHLGTPKSGTTYVQNVLWKHRAELREHGLLYPGSHYASHFWAALDLQDIDFGGYRNPAVEGAWERLLEEVRAWTGQVVVSHEMLAPARPEHIRRALADLDFADVHLVLTARDLRRQIPAVWQEDLKNRHSLDYRTFLKALSDPLGAGVQEAEVFWRMQDLTGILARWGAELPPERVHVVTVPPPGAPHDLLWHRFAELTGVSGPDFDVSQIRSNPSLGAVEAGVLRRINLNVDSRPPAEDGTPAMEWPVYEKVVKLRLATRMLARRELKLKFDLPAEEFDWVRGRAEGFAAEITRRGYHVLGGLAELQPAPPDPSRVQTHPDDVADGLMLDVAVDALVELAVGLEDQMARERARAQEDVRLAQEAARAAYERPILRQIAHRIARWFPPLRSLLKVGVTVRDRRRTPREEAQARTETVPFDADGIDLVAMDSLVPPPPEPDGPDLPADSDGPAAGR